jgi:hypothetical protein
MSDPKQAMLYFLVTRERITRWTMGSLNTVDVLSWKAKSGLPLSG